MTPQELNDFGWLVFQIAIAAGFTGGIVHAGFVNLLWFVFDQLEYRADKQARIRDARWRARWNGFNREAAELGLQGREAVLWAANAMRTHRQVLQELPHA